MQKFRGQERDLEDKAKQIMEEKMKEVQKRTKEKVFQKYSRKK